MLPPWLGIEIELGPVVSSTDVGDDPGAVHAEATMARLRTNARLSNIVEYPRCAIASHGHLLIG